VTRLRLRRRHTKHASTSGAQATWTVIAPDTPADTPQAEAPPAEAPPVEAPPVEAPPAGDSAGAADPASSAGAPPREPERAADTEEVAGADTPSDGDVTPDNIPTAVVSGDPALRHVARAYLAIEPTTVIVVGERDQASVPLISALAGSGHSVVAAEDDQFAAGLRLAQLGVVVPPPEDPNFSKALFAVVRHSGAKVVVATGASVMRRLSAISHELKDLGASVWVPKEEVFELCTDRSLLYELLLSSGLTEQKTGFGPEQAVDTAGRPFAVDVVAGRDYDLVACVSAWKLAQHAGIATVSETFSNPRLTDLVRAVCATMRLEGPAMVEGRYDEVGHWRLRNIRPGVSPMLPLDRAAGVDIAALVLAGALGIDLPAQLVRQRTGVKMTQYLDQIFEG